MWSVVLVACRKPATTETLMNANPAVMTEAAFGRWAPVGLIAHNGLRRADSGDARMTRPYEVIDADGHVLEPANLWLDYMEPRFRDCNRSA